jgi:Protein of unknown function (DUF2723)
MPTKTTRAINSLTEDGEESPLESFRVRSICATIVFVVVLAVYVATLAPTVTFVDSGELIVASKYLGVAHPPGTPLYLLLAHLFTLLPVGNVAWRVNLASALFAAVAAATTSLLEIEILCVTKKRFAAESSTRRKDKSHARKRADRKRRVAQTFDNAPIAVRLATAFLPALIAGLMLAFSRTLWSFATVAEVYTLNTLLIVIVLFLMFRWRRSRQIRILYLAMFIFGLALGVHHATVGVILPALALVVVRTEGWRFFKSTRFLYASLVSFGAMVLIYAYLPLAAMRSPIINWGDPRTLQRIWWHVSGRQYQVFLSFSLEQMMKQAAAFGGLAAKEFGPLWLPLAFLLAFLGLAYSFRRDRTVFYFLLLVILTDLAYSLNYEIAEDKGAYYLPAFLSVVIAAGLGARWLINYAVEQRWHKNILVWIATLIAMLAPMLAVASNFAVSNRHQYFLAADYINNIESAIAPNGMLLTGDWQVYSPLLYLREIENQRRDIIAIDVNMLRRSWYFDYLETQYPELMKQRHAEVSAFLEDLRFWENNQALYARDVTLNQRINLHFFKMIEAFIGSQVKSAPVYVTLDVAFDSGQNAELSKSIKTTYQIVPQGLVMQLSGDKGFITPADIQLATGGLIDRTVRFDRDDVVAQKVLPVYVNMLYNRGAYFAAHGHQDEAVQSYRQALALDPSNALLSQALAASENALRKTR